MTIAKRIKALRTALNLSQTVFAEKIGRKQQTITAWESGAREVPDYAYLLIAQSFDCSADWLRTGNGEMFAEQTGTAEETARSKRAIAEQYLLEKFRELSPELQTDVLCFCAFLIDQNAKHLKKRLDEVVDASSVDGDVGDNQPS